MAHETEKTVRTRFAPSPTGPFHMGSARTALFNYLFAKKQKGTFVLRIEDTDKERSLPVWEKDILDNLQWLGIAYNEGPFRQSERTELYTKYLQQLLQEKKAYWCFCTEEELEAQRQDQMSRGVAPHYTGTCRNLSQEEQERNLTAAKPGVIRFIVAKKTVTFHDLIRGEVKFDAALSGDIVIAKDLKTPLYNFSVVIDDHEMDITHVIRGEDHISNTPKQLLLQEALGFKKTIHYAHLPLLLGEDRTKLSKRHGDNSVTRFRQEGYLPEAVVNFLALLGWNPGDEREVFTLPALEQEFSLERVQKGGAIFNIKRLEWINGVYIRNKSAKELAELCIPYLKEAEFLKDESAVSQEMLENIILLYKERLKKLSEIVAFSDFFFQETLTYPKELLQWKQYSQKDAAEALRILTELLGTLPEQDWTQEKLMAHLLPEAEKRGDRGYLLWPMRVALSGKQASPGPFEIAEIVGKEKTLVRIKQAASKLA